MWSFTKNIERWSIFLCVEGDHKKWVSTAEKSAPLDGSVVLRKNEMKETVVI